MNYSNDFPLNMGFLGQNHNNNNNDDNYCTYSGQVSGNSTFLLWIDDPII